MGKRIWLCLLFAATGAAAIAFYFGCSSTNSSSSNQTITLDIAVQQDDLFGFKVNQVVGQARFDRVNGPVGLYVQGQVFINVLSQFPNQQINMRIELENQDASANPWPPIEWVQQGNLENVELVIPLVETIPSLLDFRVLAYYFENGSDDDASPTVGADEQSPGDDDTSPADDDATPSDDDASPADDDASPADDDDDDDVSPTDDDIAPDDDASPADDDASPADDDASPSKAFEAWAVYPFLVNEGGPTTGK